MALGAVAQTSGTAQLTAAGDGGLAFGTVASTTGTAQIQASAVGSFAQGRVAIGAAGTNAVTASGAGSMAQGNVAATSGSNSIATTGAGSLARGDVSTGGSIVTSSASSNGATAQGYALGAAITASNTGALAGGTAIFAAITASGSGNIAYGQADTGVAIVASGADNCFQFGKGTNNKASSLQVGVNGTGIRLVGDGSTLTTNGEIGTISGLAKIRSNGLNVAIAPTPKAWTIENPTNAENVSGFFTTTALTIASCRAVQRGTTPSVTFSILSGADRSSATTTHVSAEPTTSTTTGDSITVDVAAIPANTFVWLTTSAQSGTSTELNVTIMVYPT